MKIKTLTMFLLLQVFNSCIIEGDKERPVGKPCGEIQLNPQNCGFLNDHEMSVQFTIDPTTNPDLCDSEAPIDLKLNIEQSGNNPVVSWNFTGVNAGGETIHFSSTNPVVQDVTDTGSYLYTGIIDCGNEITNNTAPLPVITVTTYETTSTNTSGYQLDENGYQPSCTYVVTPPTCNTQYTAYCHAVPGAPDHGIASYQFAICDPFSMLCRFTVEGFDIQPGSDITYILTDVSGNTISTTQAMLGTDAPITFPTSGGFTLQACYQATGAIPVGGDYNFTNLHIPGTYRANTTANFYFGQKLHNHTGDTDCTN